MLSMVVYLLTSSMLICMLIFPIKKTDLSIIVLVVHLKSSGSKRPIMKHLRLLNFHLIKELAKMIGRLELDDLRLIFATENTQQNIVFLISLKDREVRGVDEYSLHTYKLSDEKKKLTKWIERLHWCTPWKFCSDISRRKFGCR